ncbi:MAG: DNA/RNA non-specific endonuclease [Prevotella sp.]|nr:DNA/RNA non-specific endonuclease [Prevotella sp.]
MQLKKVIQLPSLGEGLRVGSALLFPLLAMALVFTACSSDDDDNKSHQPVVKNANANNARQTPELARLEMPHTKGGSSVIIVHKCLLNSNSGETGVNYTVEWDAAIRAQRWSCYQMNKSLRQANTSRYYANTKKGEEQYPHDENLAYEYQLPSDPYKGSGFDHGHICPSGDRLSSFEANYQTFFLTNMQPQYKAFNGSLTGSESYKNDWTPWKRLENKVRNWTDQKNTDTLYVCKGGTIDSKENIMRSIGSGPSQIPVPKYFFMAILCKNSDGYKAIGFWMEHKSSYANIEPLSSFATNIRTLEEKTGIDFFCNLPDDIEDTVENNVYLNSWGL